MVFSLINSTLIGHLIRAAMRYRNNECSLFRCFVFGCVESGNVPSLSRMGFKCIALIAWRNNGMLLWLFFSYCETKHPKLPGKISCSLSTEINVIGEIGIAECPPWVVEPKSQSICIPSICAFVLSIRHNELCFRSTSAILLARRSREWHLASERVNAKFPAANSNNKSVLFN